MKLDYSEFQKISLKWFKLYDEGSSGQELILRDLTLQGCQLLIQSIPNDSANNLCQCYYMCDLLKSNKKIIDTNIIRKEVITVLYTVSLRIIFQNSKGYYRDIYIIEGSYIEEEKEKYLVF